MKFKDTIIVIFLAVILIYAICCRNNIIKYKPLHPVETAGICHFNWMDTICFNDFKIYTDSLRGITVQNSAGKLLMVISDLKPEAFYLEQDKVVQGDTLNLLFCKLNVSDSIQYYSILNDGTLKKIRL